MIFFLVGVACGSKQIPKYDRPIWAFDNRDSFEMLFRFKDDEKVLRAEDPRVRGMVCFLPDDFEKFVQTYIGSCETWKRGTTMTSVSSQLKDSSP